MEAKQLKVYWTVINGERFSPALSEEEARQLIRMDAKELQTKPSEWGVDTVTEAVVVVDAALTEMDGVRVAMWTCPHTGETVHSELLPEEESPALMFTNQEGSLALVSW